MVTGIVKNLEFIEFKINEKSLNIAINFTLIAKEDNEIFEYSNSNYKLSIKKFPKVNDVRRYGFKKIKDETLERIVFKRPDKEFCCSRFMDKNPSEKDENSIVLILESPHKDEFDENFDPIAPAQGSTGLAIKNKINVVLMEIEQKESLKFNFEDGIEYRLIIANPVPYQTSLWHFHQQSLSISKYKTIRDNVWKGIWNLPIIKNDFEERLKSYNPKLIINACTSKLTSEIDTFLIDTFLTTKLVSTYHPAVNWNKASYKITDLTKEK